MDGTGELIVECGGEWDRDHPSVCDFAAYAAASREEKTSLGERRQEVTFEGNSEMNFTRIRAALDECLLTEKEIAIAATSAKTAAAGGAEEDGAAALVGGMSRLMKTTSSSPLAAVGPEPPPPSDGVGGVGGGGGGGVTGDGNDVGVGVGVGVGAGAGGGAGGGGGGGVLINRTSALLSLGGKVGIIRPEAFVPPAKGGVEEKMFPEGVGHFWPKMPCLECGSGWWLGDDWDAMCANCGGDAESYDNDQQPHKAYKRRFKRFRELMEELLAKR